MTGHIGIHEENRKSVAAKLEVLLADTYLLYLKTQNFHWNVTGVHFPSLHALFEGQYEDLADAVDEIAERIRTLGVSAPGSFKAFLAQATLSEAKGGETAEQMIAALLADHEQMAQTIRDALPGISDVDDEGTVGLLAERMAAHEKTAWMLRSSR